jgi:hypothetical protein
MLEPTPTPAHRRPTPAPGRRLHGLLRRAVPLLLQAPAPVVAQALGNHSTTTRVATEAGTPWSRYASGDHSRWPPT